MNKGKSELFQHVRRLFHEGTLTEEADGPLLRRFVSRNDEAAFQVLVTRHGPMVLRVCRDLLRDRHAAEDAFQVTFLILARKAQTLWVNDSLSVWLYGVTRKVATRARFAAERQRRHELQAAGRTLTETETIPSRFDEAAILHEEINRLPETYQRPLVLCYFEGMSYEQVAARLGVSETTVRGRLARGKDRLRARLTRRGVTAPAGLLLAGLSANATSHTVAAALVERSAAAALQVLTTKNTLVSSTSAWLVLTVKGVMPLMLTTPGKVVIVATLLAVGLMVQESRRSMSQVVKPAEPSLPSPLPGQAENEPAKDEPKRDPAIPMPWETTVRIKISASAKDAIGFGSGTIIGSTSQEALILTCAHIIHVDRKAVPFPSLYKNRVTVDLFDGTPPSQVKTKLIETVSGEVVDIDLERDVCLLRIPTNRRLPVSPIIARNWVPEKNLKLTTGGCSLGQEPTFWTTYVIQPKASLLSGKPNYEAILCKTAPKQGRSGGGLFTDEGYLVGVCNYSEPSANLGYYISTRNIYRIIDQNPMVNLHAGSLDTARSSPRAGAVTDTSPTTRSRAEIELEALVDEAEREAKAGGSSISIAKLKRIDDRYRAERDALQARLRRLDSLYTQRIELLLQPKAPDSDPEIMAEAGPSPEQPEPRTEPDLDAHNLPRPILPSLEDHEARLRELERRLNFP